MAPFTEQIYVKIGKYFNKNELPIISYGQAMNETFYHIYGMNIFTYYINENFHRGQYPDKDDLRFY